MARISAYESTDGRIFKERDDWKAHQAWLDLVVLLEGMGIEEPDAVVRDLVGHRDDVIRLLRNAKEVR